MHKLDIINKDLVNIAIEDIKDINKIDITNHKKYHNDIVSKLYLKECEKLYNLKYRNNLTDDDISEKYNIRKDIINYKIRNYEMFLYLDIKANHKRIIKLGKKIENLKLSGLTNKDIIKRLNISDNRMRYIYKRYKEFMKNKELYKIN